MNLSFPSETIIEAKRSKIRSNRALLVGISGIDASGKGFITSRLASVLRDRGFRVAGTNVDGWLSLPEIRFYPDDLPGNFYRNGLRLDEMFESLVLPLRDRRSIRLEANYTEETATAYRRHRYNFDNVDIILLEGIFIFKRNYVRQFDLRIWIECSFETALRRAIARSQEGLTPEETVAAYERIYFPAQRIHFANDDPRSAADVIYPNE